MTPEQHAEAMGLSLWKDKGNYWHRVALQPPGTVMDIGGAEGGRALRLHRKDDSIVADWNPLTDANDALELAEKMKVQFGTTAEDTFWAAVRVKLYVTADTLPAAICAAVAAALEAKSAT